MSNFARLSKKARKTAAVSSGPPNESASFFAVWRRASAPFALIPLTASALLLTGCIELSHTATGPLREQPVSVDLNGAQRADVELDLGAGELNVNGGAQKLMEGTFQYNVPQWEPTVHTSANGSHATITIKEPEHVRLGGNQKYKWDLTFNDKVLYDFAVNCGAGQARLQLGDLGLRSVTVHIGVGEVNLDLQGHPTHDYDVNISGGIGQATVRLPQDVGIWAQAHGGIGSIDVTGLDKHGDHYENSLYDSAKVNVRLKVDGGIGQIRIIG
jgi:hypothetical protein